MLCVLGVVWCWAQKFNFLYTWKLQWWSFNLKGGSTGFTGNQLTVECHSEAIRLLKAISMLTAGYGQICIALQGVGALALRVAVATAFQEVCAILCVGYLNKSKIALLQFIVCRFGKNK